MNFFLNPLIHNEVFLVVCACMLFFSPSNILNEFFLSFTFILKKMDVITVIPVVTQKMFL